MYVVGVSFVVQAQSRIRLRLLRSGRRGWRSAALLAALVALGLGLAACGGGSSNASSNSASLAISGCSPSGCSSPGASAAAEAMAVKFSGCMRSHGVSDFPDPTVGTNGLPSFGPTDNVKAGRRCSTRLNRPARGTCPASRRARPPKRRRPIAAALRYAACMRSNGVPNFPDPNGQGLIQINATGTLEPSSPAFQKAGRPARVSTTASLSSSASASSASGGAGSGS